MPSSGTKHLLVASHDAARAREEKDLNSDLLDRPGAEATSFATKGPSVIRSVSGATALHAASKGPSEVFRRQDDPDQSEQRYCFEIYNDWREASGKADQSCRNQRRNATTENDAQLFS
jgi:hypothetical protein